MVLVILFTGCKDDEPESGGGAGLQLTINGSAQFFKIVRTAAELAAADNILIDASGCSGNSCGFFYSADLESSPLESFTLTVSVENTVAGIEALANKTFTADMDTEDKVYLSLTTADGILSLDENATNTVSISAVSKTGEVDGDIEFEMTGELSAKFLDGDETYEVSGTFTLPISVSSTN